ncbi:MAG: gliding motility-associated C-terminal domain-containing protein [Sphingobacteriaceae bacterium]|nr:gliding motility-associated C-terminal domain-containing protein [Sphingobacteriaceae bacterium]
MKNKLFSLVAILFAVFIFNTTANAQAPFKYLTYIFPSDSMQGFDENAAKNEALSRGFFGSEYHVIMYSMKRDYINKKYGYTYGTTFGSNAKGGPSTPSINAAPCINEDFESSPSTISTTTVGTIGTGLVGWTASWGQNSGVNGSCTQAGCCPNAGSTDAWIRTTPWTAPAPLGVIPASPFGGTKVIQMNDNITAKGEVVRIQQTFPVTSSNALFQFCYKAAMDGSGHACCDQPYIRVELLDCMNNILACPQVSITPPGPSCATVSATGWSVSGNISYTPNWIIKAIDLTPYMGTCVTIKITVGDCDGWAHYGYAFFDCQCLPMTINVNNILFPAGNAAVAVAACGVSTASMTAPPGLGPYSWTGPVSTFTNNANQTVTTTVPGNYTLTMTPQGVCTPITRTVNLQFGTFPTAGFTSANSCTTYTLTNTGTGPPSVQTYSFVGPGSPTSFTTTNATSVINFAPSTTYTIYQTVTNPQNCPATFSMVITTPPGPSPAFTASPSFTQCLTGNAFTFNATTAAGTHTYNFNPTVGSPPTGNTNPYGPVSFTAPGNYTVTHTVNSAGCVSSTQSVVVVNAKPTASASATPPACSGGQAILTGSGGPGSISWSGPLGFTGVGVPLAINNFTSGNQGTYTMTVNNFGCITTTTVNITMPAVPSVTVTNTGPYCVGQTIQMNAVSSATNISWSYWYNSTWTWYNFSSTLTPTITNAQTTSSGVYYFYVSWAGGCWATASTTVNVVATPTVAASNTGPYCPGATVQLNSPTAAGSYTWAGPSSFTSSVQNPTTTTASNAVYTVMIGSGSCTAAATTSVVINPVPSPTATSNSPVCLGAPITLSVNAATSYTWSGPGGFTSNLQNPIIASSTSTMAGVYTVTVSNAQGCKATTTLNMVITTPTTSAANTGPYCAGATISLSTPVATTYTWTGPSAFTSNVQNPNIASSTAAMSGIYTVTSTTGGCNATATTNVIVNALATPTASNTGPYCPGNTIQLNVGAFTTYTWTGPSAFSSNSQNPTQTNAQTTNAGNYIITVTDANGCVNSATTTVVVNPTPTVVIGSNSPVCINQAINLTSSGGTGYAWSGPNAFTSALQNPTIPAATSAEAGVYTVTVTSLGCTSTGTVNVTVTTPTTSASNSGPFCAGSTINLSAIAATSYTWSGPLGYTSNLQNATQANATTAMAGTYSVIVSIGTCTASATTNVVVNPLPVPAPTNTGPYCPGNTIQLNEGAFTTYTWTGPSAFSSNLQNPTQTNAQTTNGGVYTVSVTDANGCVNSGTTTVVVNPTPVVVIGSNSPVCINTAINLTSSGGTGYAWSGPNAFTSALQNPTIPAATSAEAGVYTVTVTSLGCANTGTVNVTVTTPTTSAANTGPYCAGTTINLNAPAATTYTWSGPGGFTSNSQNATQPSSTPAMSGTYSVIVSIGTCTASATTNVVVNALPTPTATSNSPVCVGQAINLTGAGALTYTWTGPSAFNSNSSTPSIPVSVTSNAGNYVLTVTDVNGCKNTTNVNVVVNSLPVIAVTNPTNCVNTTINLTSSGGVTYSWSGPGGFTSTAQNPNITGAQLTMSGVYVVTVTDANGCINTANANVSVLPLPTPNITSNSPVCVGATLNLFGTGGASYAWSGPGYTGLNQNPTITNVTAAANGVYTLLVSSGTCTASTTFTVVINPLPVFNFTGSNVLCNGQSNGTSTVNVTVGTGPFNYNWSTIPAQTTQDASGLAAGTYSCFVTDANGCSSVSSTQITQPTAFSVSINSTTLSACVNNPISINANGNGGTGPYSYNWVSGPSTGAYSITETLSGNFNYVVNAVDAFNCPASANINLTFFPQPTVTATSATLCAGQNTASLVATGATSYVWQPGNITGSTYSYSGNTSVNVTVIGTSNGCSNSANASIVVNPNPNANISVSGVKGCVPTCVTFTANNSTSNIVSYSWILNGAGITGAQNGVYCFDESASYTLGLTVVDGNGCTSTVSPMNIEIYPQPVADFNHAPIKPIINQDPFVTFTDASWGANIVSWNWYFMNTAQYTSTQQNPTFMYTEPGTYPVALVVTSDKGCTDTIVRPLIVGEDFGIYVPNAFTPNADGVNDIFQPKGFGVVKYEINIFDRWGERVFHTTTFEEGWDGTFQGRGQNICKEDSYTWIINATSVFGKSHELKGHVTLIR